LEYHCTDGKLSVVPAADPGTPARIGNFMYSPGAIRPEPLPVPVQVMLETSSSTGPSSVWIGVASLRIRVTAFQPGVG
jgi:hypothetical protein